MTSKMLVLLVAQPPRHDRPPRRVAEVGDREAGDGPQAPVLEQAGHLVDVLVGDLEFLHQHAANLGVGADRHLEPHHAFHPPGPDPFLNGRQQVRHLVEVAVDVGVARDAERRDGANDHVGKQRRQVRRNQVRQGHEPPGLLEGGRLEPHPLRQRVRHLDPRKGLFRRLRVFEDEPERDRQVGDERKRVPDVHREGRQHREDRALEQGLGDGTFLRGQIVPAEQMDIARRQRGPDGVGVDIGLAGEQVGDGRTHRRQQPAGGRRKPFDVGTDLFAEPEDALHHELVEIRREDREEAEALEQRRSLVRRLVEHAAVEFEPAEIPVQEFGLPVRSRTLRV